MIEAPPAIICEQPRAIDGDTIACANLARHVRLLGIDAPELDGHCRIGRVCTPGDGAASQRQLAELLRTGAASVETVSFDRYGRILARARIGKVDLSCKLVESGAAVLRYARIDC